MEENAADCVEPNVIGDVYLLDMSVIFAADNVDQNIITIDGKGKFHGMPRVSLPLSSLENRQTILFHEDRSRS